jgi:aryl-alcohol dehydrogenase-like predicted oxidoreductase/enamine deaminase RidA (YjgF/YER057c/UK114 family)
MGKQNDFPTTNIGDDFNICKITSGLWQVSGGHGTIEFNTAVQSMVDIYNRGFTTFDMADHYGPAEDITGAFYEQIKSNGFPNGKPQIMTKWVPEPGVMNESVVRSGIEKSLKRLKTDSLDLLQFHWWDYLDPRYLSAMEELTKLKEEGLIRKIGLTNFDAAHAGVISDSGFSVASNQVHFSLLDERPVYDMKSYCEKHGVKLLCYGTVAGGFLSEKWMGKNEPSFEDVSGNWSLMKYLRFIQTSGTWQKFQDLLSVLSGIAEKHEVGISNIAMRWVLEHDFVAAALVGNRLGISEHLDDNKRVFDFKLDVDDIAAIAEVKKEFVRLPGDCGDEYRKPPFLTASGDLSDHKTHSWRQPLTLRHPVEKSIHVTYDSGTEWEKIAGYSRAVRKDNSIHVSGTTATIDGKVITPGCAATQAEICIDKIEAAVEALGGRLEDIVRTRIYVPRLQEDWEAVALVHGRRFEGIKPANTLVSAGLVGSDYLVEIEADAEISDKE